MEYKYLTLEYQDRILLITINNPETLNSLNTSILIELDNLFTEISTKDDLIAVIITGAGKAFVAGADIAEMKNMDVIEGKALSELGSKVFRNIETSKKIVIAAINGYALGGGCELALACDLRFASENAKFGQPEVGLGIIPGFSGTQRLPRLIGIAKAKELMYTADIINAEEAYRIGLVNKIFPLENLLNECKYIARKIVSKSQTSLEFLKQAINDGMEGNINEGIIIENNLFGLCFETKDQKEGMNAFLEKRTPQFENK